MQMITRKLKMNWSTDTRLHRIKRRVHVVDALVYLAAGTLLGMTLFGITPAEAWRVIVGWIGR